MKKGKKQKKNMYERCFELSNLDLGTHIHMSCRGKRKKSQEIMWLNILDLWVMNLNLSAHIQ